jgi:hypothetical protein
MSLSSVHTCPRPPDTLLGASSSQAQGGPFSLVPSGQHDAWCPEGIQQYREMPMNVASEAGGIPDASWHTQGHGNLSSPTSLSKLGSRGEQKPKTPMHPLKPAQGHLFFPIFLNSSPSVIKGTWG